MTQSPQRYEAIHLLIAIRTAIETGAAARDPALHAARLERLADLDRAAWLRLVSHLPELAPYQTLTEGILHTAHLLQLPLPPIEDQSHDLLGGPRAGFSAVVDDRSLRVLAFGDATPAPYYAIDLFDLAAMAGYQGDAPTLAEATHLISDWLAQNVPTAVLVQRYAWMRPAPVQAAWRMRIDDG